MNHGIVGNGKLNVWIRTDVPFIFLGIKGFLESRGYITVRRCNCDFSPSARGNEILVVESISSRCSPQNGWLPLGEKCATLRRVLLLRDDHYHCVPQMAQAGFHGFLLESCAPVELLAAVKAVAIGQTFLSAGVRKKAEQRFLNQTPVESRAESRSLTNREREILQLVSTGCSNKQMADRLQISQRTVEHHRAALTNRLGVKSAAELVKFAIRYGLASLE